MPTTSPAAPTPDKDALVDLRRRIDAIDAELHGLLIERSSIIDALIEAKGTQETGAAGPTGAAFRPLREADMMRRLVERHSGTLPIMTVEHIWREIISTFTRLQADYVVHFDGSADDLTLRDAARFYFGFAVDLSEKADAVDVVDAVAGSVTDLGVVPLVYRAEQPWWEALGHADAAGRPGPRILARLPFLLAAGRPADLPCLVISPPVAEPGEPDIRVFAAGWPHGREPAAALAAAGIEILALSQGDQAVNVLLAVPGDLDAAALADLMRSAGIAEPKLRDVGGYAAAIDLEDDGDDDF